jgi:hypothetical protein
MGRWEDPLGARGPSSDREFEPEHAGGPIRRLTTDRIRITGRGIDAVQRHVARFGPDPMNEAMIRRLREIEAGHLSETQYDLNFYTHELREAVRYRRLGWPEEQPADDDAAHDLWNDAHTATLEDYRLSAQGKLYHPDVVSS